MSREQLLKEITVKMSDTGLGKNFKQSELRSSLMRYSDATLAKLNLMYHPLNGHNKVVLATIGDSVQKRAVERRLLDMMDYLPEMYAEKPFIRLCSMALLSLNEYRKLGWIPRTKDDVRDPSIHSFLIAANQLRLDLHKTYEKQGYDTLSGEYPSHAPFRKVEPNDENPVYFVLKDEWLVRLLLEHAEDSDVITDLLCERGSDYELLAQILNHENKALVSGIL